MKRDAILRLSNEHSIRTSCRALGISRSSYYESATPVPALTVMKPRKPSRAMAPIRVTVPHFPQTLFA